MNVSVIQAKETLVIEKDPVFVPVESWINAAQVRTRMIKMEVGHHNDNG